jgi:Txe/YoeB family toxin of Txe-Axe toxin-antitoxin module
MQIKELRNDLEDYIDEHNLRNKWKKSKQLFENNIRHPSLNTELMEPHWRGIYSFRLDKKYRALFFITENHAEIFKITNHYKK